MRKEVVAVEIPSATTRAAYAGTILFGGAHALASLYWGCGGTALVSTIGQEAVRWRAEQPLLCMGVLLLVGLLKVAGIVVPLLNARGSLPWRRLLHVASWLGGLGLVLYGGIIAATAHLALAGRFGTVDDRRGMLGHAWLWDPLFALWGLSLLVALATDRRWRTRRSSGRDAHRGSPTASAAGATRSSHVESPADPA